MAKVLHGDRVLARITGADRRGRPEGEIVEVIESRTNKLVGRLLNERGVMIVVPEDQRIAHDCDIDVHLVESALECVVLGAGRCIEEPAALRVVFQSGAGHM